MSYDLNNYVFKGVPLNAFVANLSNHPAGTQFHLASEDEPKNFLLVEENLVTSLRDTQALLNHEIDRNPIDVSKFAEALTREQDSIGSAKHLLMMTILRACGIAVIDVLAVQEESNLDVFAPYNPHLVDIQGLPFVEMNGDTLSMGAIEIPSVLKGLVGIASRKENWRLLQDPRTDPETYETSEPALTMDLAKTIAWAQNSSVSSRYDCWREDYCAKLINMFIKPGEEYVEEDECWTSDVGVCSTRHGDVHNYGGMKENEMYLIVSGNEMSCYDEEGWSDPEKETPTAYKKLKELLFGDPDYPTKKYTPQFGG